MKNGYILGPILIILGAVNSYYTAMLMVKCSENTGKTRFEDIALKLYGPKMSKLTSILNLICLNGFTFSFIVYVSKAIPMIIGQYTDDKDLLQWIGDTDIGKVIWGLVYSYGILFPMSIPRKLSALRISSFLGVLCSLYLSLAVMFIFLINESYVPNRQ